MSLTWTDILFWAYVLIGPAAWVLLAWGMLMGRRHMRRLQADWQRYPLPDPPPAVTALVPAKDEGPRVRLCLESVLAQDYPRLELIAIDDRSSDDTGRILDEAAAGDDRVRALHVPPGGLPAGWLGKCHALHVGAAGATGEWLFFVDSDVRLAPHALRAALGLSVNRKYDAVSLLTRLECHTSLERLVLPLAAGAWSVMNQVSLTNDDNRPDVAYANGQFFLIRRSAYELVGGHEAVKDRITEDVELVRLMKSRGLRVRLFLGEQLASTKMHATLGQMLKGWGRIYSGTSRRRPWRIVATMAVLLVCGFSVYPALVAGLVMLVRHVDGAGAWLAASLVHLAALTWVLAGVYRDSGNPRWLAALFPAGGGVLLGLLAFALKWCITGRIEWRGTVFDQRARAGAATRPE